MIREQLILDVHDELIVDNFAGGGGASTGIEWATGRHVDHAINHDRLALGMHRINHPQTVHHTEDIFDVDPDTVCEGRSVALAHFSPDCKHFSKAKGGQPLNKRIRGLVLVMLVWAKYGCRVMTMENVEEITTWGPLKRMKKKGKWGMFPDPEHRGRTWLAFLDCLGDGIDANHPDLPEILSVLGRRVTKAECVRGFHFTSEYREVRACDYGSRTIRKRLFMISRSDGRPIVWPEPTHFQNPTRRQKPWGTVSECIDWELPCPSIFLTKQQARKAKCKRPLADATMRRIAMGMDRHVLKADRPFLVSLTHQGGDRVESVDEPVKTITGAHRGEKALVATTILRTDMPKSNALCVYPPEDPLRTITAGGGFGVSEAKLAPFVTEHANANKQKPYWPVDDPLRTQCAEVKGGHFAMVAGTIVGAGGPTYSGKPKSVDVPMNAQTTENHAALAAASLVKLRGTNIGDAADTPLHTISAGGTHHGLIAAHMTKFNTGAIGSEMTQPIPTIPAGSHSPETHGGAATPHGVVAASLTTFNGRSVSADAGSPGLTVTTKERLGCVEALAFTFGLTETQLAGARRVAKFLRKYGVEFEGEFATVGGYVIVDIGMRMLTPRELFRAQGFPDSYVIDRAWVVDPETGEVVEIMLTKEQRIRMCGNSVCPQVMAALVRANVPELIIRYGDESKAMVVA